jgi:hypothetical protein
VCHAHALPATSKNRREFEEAGVGMARRADRSFWDARSSSFYRRTREWNDLLVGEILPASVSSW